MIKRSTILACLAALAAHCAFAQDGAAPHVTLTAGAAYEQSLDRPTFPFVTGLENAPDEWSGSFTGSALRITGTYTLSRSLDVGIRLERSRLTGVFTTSLPGALVLLNGSPTPVEQSIIGEDEFVMTMLRSDLFLRYKLPVAGLALELGGTAGSRSFDRFRQTMTLVKPDTAHFQNPSGLPMELDGRRIVFYDGPLQSATVASIMAGVSAEIPIDGGFSIRPELMLRKDLNATLQSGEEFFSWYASGGLSLSYAILPSRPESAPPPPDGTGLLPDPAKRFALSASLDLYSVDAEGRRIPNALFSTGEIAYTHGIALPMTLYFDRDSRMIPERHTSRAGSAEHHATADSIAQLPPDEAYYHLLDRAGERLTARSGARLVLHCGKEAGEREEIAGERGESVARFLAERWHIDRVRISAANDRSGPLVELEVIDGEPNALMRRWSDRYIRTTAIKVDPAIDAEAGVKSWGLTFTQEGRVLAARKSDSVGSGDLDLAMIRNAMRDDELPAPVIAELVAEDSASQQTAVSSTLRFERDPNRAAGDSVVMIHDLFGSAAGPESKELTTIAGSIAGSRTAAPHVTISPIFITRGGARSADRLESIATRLREELRRAGATLPSNAVQATPGGIYRRRDDGTPEDDMLNDGVRIVVSGRRPS